MLQEQLDRLQLNSEKTIDNLDYAKFTNPDKDIDMDENADSFVDGSVMEKVLQKRSLRMRNMQRAWQVFIFIFIFLILLLDISFGIRCLNLRVMIQSVTLLCLFLYIC